MLLVGSKAFYMGRESRDIDYIASLEELDAFKTRHRDDIVLAKPSRRGQTIFMTGSVPIEFDVSDTGQQLLEIVRATPSLLARNTGYNNIAGPEILLALKLSHRYIKNSPHFLKTMTDIWYLRNEGYVVPECLKEWVKIRARETYDYGHPSLARSKNDFFANDGVGYCYDHDSLHESIKTFDVPAFNLIKLDGAEVYCSKEKFYEVSEAVRLATVLEEVEVLSLERSQIPNDFKIDRKKSFDMAHSKVCTSISSGFWREFAWEHYQEVQAMYRDDYVDRFKKALTEGIIKPYVS